MFKLKRGYFYPAILLIISIVFIISSCGGGSNNGTLPVTNTNSNIDSNPSAVTSTPTPVLIQKPIQGYIYGNNITTEDGEIVPCINVLDVPACQAHASGNEPFVTQFSNTMKEDYPEDWAKAEIQELYAQLNKTLSESKPLPEYNAQAQLCSAYDDTSIPVGSDGHFDNTVLTGATDSNVKLEVALGEDNYTEVETLPSSGSINSSDATSAAVLKSCPEKIFAFPGEIVIFKVYSEPGINLKSAGLKFTLNNSSIGCITQPVYLCLFGAHKYQVAYGCVYIKHGLDTPVNTTITAKTNTGQSMSIFLEVIKKTASISGTVCTNSMPLVKGFVHSLGPKACCKLDSNGGYTLPKVFRGHGRSVVATWWTTDENGKKVRHREEKIIYFFDSDVTEFNFGVPPTPTPTATPTIIFPTSGDEYHDYLCAGIITQKQKWQKELGYPEGIKRTIEWINGTVTEPPLPPFIKEGIAKADVDGYNPYIMFLFFKDGYETLINDSALEDYLTPVPTASVTHTQNKQSNNSIIANATQSGTLKNSNVLLLGPAAFDRSPGSEKNEMFSSTADYLTSIGYKVANLAIESTDLDTNGNVTFHYEAPTFWEKIFIGEEYPLQHCEIKDESKVMRPKDFENMDAFGIIYIYTHGYTPRPLPIIKPGGDVSKWSQAYLMTCPVYERKNSEGKYEKDEILKKWEDENPPHWLKGNTYLETYNAFSPIIGGKTYYYKALLVRTTYFAEVNKDFSGSLVYLNACFAFDIYKDEEYNPFKNAKIFVGPQNVASKVTASNSASSFFKYMLGGIPYSTKPLNAREAYNQVIKELPDIEPLFIIYGLDNRYFINIDTGPSNINDNTYLPGDASVTVHKKGNKL